MIPVAEPNLDGNELKYVVDCVKTGWISSIGSYVTKFENTFSRYCGMKHGIAVANGTVALHVALEALGIKKGDEVIIPSLTFVATANAVKYTGAKPVFVDSEPRTWNIDPEKIEEKITPRTKAIIPVHLYGHPCDMGRITEIAEKHDLAIIEDAAEAHGAEYKGKKIGSLSAISCFSFYGNKILTTGEGGMCLTNDEKLVEKMRQLKDHGMSANRRYYHLQMGYNYRLTNIQAAIGLAQLEKLEETIAIKRKNVQLYNSLLRNIKGITLPVEESWAKNVYWLYSILIEKDYKLKRDELMLKLKKEGIETRPFFLPLHQMP
ncbi:MAG: DegT/DnrJ/EryC1/StrS family aminotransferase, partial [Nanoarchaeota archaeon]|nr:DegT/DnrJ/EryC1/StrS family aminotransferase [Nanoarchaeota archaeon]